MWLAPEYQAMQAALLLTSLLRTPSCPALSLLDRRACDALLKLLRSVAQAGAAGGGSGAPAKSNKAAKDQARRSCGKSDEGPEDMEVDDGSSKEEAEQVGSRQAGGNDEATVAAAMFEDVAANFAAVLGTCSLKGQAETVQQVAETFAEASRAPHLPAGAATACFAVLLALLMPLHGSMLELSAIVLRLLTPNLLAVSSGGAKAALPGRERVLELCRSALCRSPECSESVAALARHVTLRAPDKAEFRVTAVEAAVGLLRLLPSSAQKQFVVFAARLR